MDLREQLSKVISHPPLAQCQHALLCYSGDACHVKYLLRSTSSAELFSELSQSSSLLRATFASFEAESGSSETISGSCKEGL